MEEANINVLEPKQEFEVNIRFTDPCPVLKEQFPYFYSPSAEEYNFVYYAYYGCSENYHRSIVEPIHEFVNRFNGMRHRRGLPILGLIGGVWLSNAIDSYFHDNDKIAAHEQEQNELLESIN